jgi:hypothetical protein
MLLNRDAYSRARDFVATRGRPLESARLRVNLDGAPASEVWNVLRPYQNTDGGFGHGMEPDYQAPLSSALATTVALQVVRETRLAAGVEPPADLVDPAIGYLLATLDRDGLTWRMLPAGTDSSPHAPWWSQAGNEAAFAAWSLNPTAECLGYLYEYSDQVSSVLLAELAEKVLAYLAGRHTVEMHDFLCCKRWAETPDLTPAIRDRLLGELARLLDTVLCRDPGKWPAYTLRPTQVAESPSSPFSPALSDILPANLDWEIEQQQPDGSWLPNWDWGGQFPEDWERARLEWAGWITVEKLLVLARYDRISPEVPSVRRNG